MPAKSRAKGGRGEREAIAFLLDRFGVEYQRHQDATQGYCFAQDGVDLVPVERVEELPDVQVKNHAKFNANHWIADPEKAALALEGTMEPNLAWMVKAPREGWLFVGDLVALFGERPLWRLCGDGVGLALVRF